MKNSLKTGFIGGCIGAVVLALLSYVMQAVNGNEPPFVSTYHATIGTHPGDQVAAVLLFIFSGGIWGWIFGWMVKRPTILNGMLFGILPNLWLWTAVNGFLGKSLFNGFSLMGIVGPVIFNMLIWGGILGWYASGKINKKAD